VKFLVILFAVIARTRTNRDVSEEVIVSEGIDSTARRGCQ